MHSKLQHAFVAVVSLCATVLGAAPVAANDFEVWLVDQSNTQGLAYGGTLYVFEGNDLMGKQAASAQPIAAIDLATLGGGGLCFTATDSLGGGAGANPVRPHMVLFDATGSHAIVSFVASGHVAIFDAVTRAPVDCFRTRAGAGGARQAHAAFPSPDGSAIVVANQNGKLLERIDADFEIGVFTHSPAALLDLAGCVTPNGVACQLAGVRPDNAPICPIVDSSGALAFVTLRGGGLLVVDPRTSPMSIIGEYDAATVHGNGCGGVEAGGAMFLDSGGATAGNRSEFDVYRLPLAGYSAANPLNHPAPVVVFSDDYTSPTGACHGDPLCRDAHGMGVSKHGRYVWVADRHRNLLEVFDAASNARVNVVDVSLGGWLDSAPDLLDVAPQGNRLFVSLRGPNPLTGDPHVATGAAPGIMVLQVTEGGRNAIVKSLIGISNVDANGIERADAHGIRVRSR